MGDKILKAMSLVCWLIFGSCKKFECKFVQRSEKSKINFYKRHLETYFLNDRIERILKLRQSQDLLIQFYFEYLWKWGRNFKSIPPMWVNLVNS